MNCGDVEAILSQGTNLDELHDAARCSELQNHLAVCPACSRLRDSMDRWDSQLRRVMQEIEVPAGLSQRLLSSLQLASPERPAPQSPVMRVSRRMGRRLLGGVGALGLVSLLFAWAYLASSPAKLTSNDVSIIWEQVGESELPLATIEAPLPRGWSTLAGVRGTDWQSLTLSGPRLTLPVKTIELRMGTGRPETGWLLAVPKSRWAAFPLSSISQARVSYAPPKVWIAWSEGEYVYLLAVFGSPQSLERIQRHLDQFQAVS